MTILLTGALTDGADGEGLVALFFSSILLTVAVGLAGRAVASEDRHDVRGAARRATGRVGARAGQRDGDGGSDGKAVLSPPFATFLISMSDRSRAASVALSVLGRARFTRARICLSVGIGVLCIFAPNTPRSWRFLSGVHSL